MSCEAVERTADGRGASCDDVNIRIQDFVGGAANADSEDGVRWLQRNPWCCGRSEAMQSAPDARNARRDDRDVCANTWREERRCVTPQMLCDGSPQREAVERAADGRSASCDDAGVWINTPRRSSDARQPRCCTIRRRTSPRWSVRRMSPRPDPQSPSS